VSKVSPKLLEIFNRISLNTDKEVTRALVKNPKYLDNTRTTPEVADSLAQALGRTRSTVQGLNEKSFEALGPNEFAGKQSVMDALEGLPEKFKVNNVTEAYPENQAIMNEILMAKDALGKSNTQADIKSILSAVGNRANYATPSGDKINAVRKGIRGEFDNVLKAENPGYRDAMIPMAQQTELLKRGAKISGVESKKGGYAPTDLTTTRLETVIRNLDKNKLGNTKQTLEKINPGILEELNKIRIGRKAEGGVQSGSRNTLFGGATVSGLNELLGAPLPATVAAMAGGVMGAGIDKYGRNIGAMLAKNYGRLSKYSQGVIERVSPILTGANQAAAHELLITIDPEYKAVVEELIGEGFNDPRQSVNLLGSAVLGSDLTRTLAASAAGAGYAMEGRPFAEGFGERFQQLDDIDSTGAGIISGLLPVGKAGKTVNMLMRGLNVADEYLSGFGGTKTAPMLKNIQMKNNDKYKSKVQNPKTVIEKISGFPLKNGNTIEFRDENGWVKGVIDHPKYPEHTTFEIDKDKEGLWSVVSNYRKKEFKDKPELRGSSTDLRNALAKLLGGLGSDMANRNTEPGLKSYFKDANAIPTRPLDRERDYSEPFSKFFTPGSESQKKRFLKSYKESYEDTPKKPDFFKNQNGNRKIPDAVREAIESVEENNRINDASWSDWNSARHIADTYKIKMSPQDLAKLDTIMRERKRALRVNTKGGFTYKDGTIVNPERVRAVLMNDPRFSEWIYHAQNTAENISRGVSSREQLRQSLESALGGKLDNKNQIFGEFYQLVKGDDIPRAWGRQIITNTIIQDALDKFEPLRNK
jgi:hypothetical protein